MVSEQQCVLYAISFMKLEETLDVHRGALRVLALSPEKLFTHLSML